MTKLSDLPALTGRQVSVELLTDDLDDFPMEVTGKLLAVDLTEGVVVETRDGSIIVAMREIKDVSIAPPRTKIVRRMLRYMPERQTKQHLLDRHGSPWDIIKAMSHKGAHEMHELINHSNLGHRHQAQPDGEDV